MCNVLKKPFLKSLSISDEILRLKMILEMAQANLVFVEHLSIKGNSKGFKNNGVWMAW